MLDSAFVLAHSFDFVFRNEHLLDAMNSYTLLSTCHMKEDNKRLSSSLSFAL